MLQRRGSWMVDGAKPLPSRYPSDMNRYSFAIALLVVAQLAAAQGWKPDKPVELIVTCQPGCGPDGTARLIQKIWQEHRIVTVPSVVVNRAGGGGAAAFGSLHQKPGDGHMLVLSGAGPVVNTIMGRGVGYKDLTS